jgi:hypothetical protein
MRMMPKVTPWRLMKLLLTVPPKMAVTLPIARP